MAYINAEQVKAIRNALKVEFPQYKFAVRKGAGGHNVSVELKKGPAFKKFKRWDRYANNHEGAEVVEDLNKGYHDVNHYWIKESVGKANAPIFEKIVEIIKTAPAKANVGDMWYNNSDIMTDYFDVAYYFDISIGRWDQPYEVVA